MKLRSVSRTIVGALVAGVLVWAYGWYDAYLIADKACLRARVGEPAEPARAHLREIAASRGTEARDSGERATAVFRWMFSDVAACTFVVRDGKVSDVLVGPRALEVAR